MARLARLPGTTVVPLFFEGQNSRLFQLASHLSLTLRLSLVFHETARRIGEELPVHIGTPVGPEAIAAMGDRATLLAELRRITYALAPTAFPAGFHLREGHIRGMKRETGPATSR